MTGEVQLPYAAAPKQKAVIYSRVSTLLGQDPLHQLVPCRQLCENRAFEVVDEYVDHITGSSERRKDLDRLVRDARMGKFKVIVVYALDRLARDTRFLLNLLHELDGYGVCLVSIRESLDFSSPVGRAVLGVISVISQLEKEIISERIRTALAVKKMTAEQTGNGWKSGRPTKVTPELETKIIEMKNEGLSIRQIARKLSVSKTSVLRVVQKRALANGVD